MKTIIVLSAALLFVSACAASGPEKFCDAYGPIHLDSTDNVSRQTLNAIDRHNERGDLLCEWKRGK